ncbi:protein translocase subunit SecD [Nocardioides marmoribigeumensis]|uniref:Multifunctional fusion protein n=1 Tax=Nocardioides marmoribigeumensis TaxID=433649 RepID=A0ABU2BPW9_9ACTN|nr:protein translocase subunit SecD [Nocardioides marmoribigeumensis]MDR7360663.1 SecD/SecF fusion protein [Nocardioides marmoribigeumensis]
MTRAALFRLLASIAMVATAAVVAWDSSPRLGLDLSGGTQFVLETRDTEQRKADKAATDRTLEVLRGRVDALGVAEPTLVRSGDNRIIVELPGVQDPTEAADTIGKTAQLAFHPVASDPTGSTQVDETGQPIKLGKPAVIGDQIAGADAGNDPEQGSGWYVTVDFRGEGKENWRSLTADAACAAPGDPARRVAIVLDGEVISSPQVVQEIQCGAGMPGGSTQITGSFTIEEAKELALLIEGGALPVPVEIAEQRTVGPTLGKAAIEASFQAAVIGIILTGLFITIVYRLAGLLATIALACYALLSYALLVALGATLTLPGLAGFVLAIGMAIDANVLTFERSREEYADNPRLPLARIATTGFERAWTALIDSNVTTLLAAGLLFFLAAGPVKGFGITLTIGVLASMVSALVIARSLVELASRWRWLQRRPAATGFSSLGPVRTWLRRRDPDLVGRGRVWLGISAAASVVALAGIAVNGLNLAVEFTGGRITEYSDVRGLSVDDARDAVASVGQANAVVQSSGDDEISVRTGVIDDREVSRIRDALSGAAGGDVTKVRDELIGASMGPTLRNQALIALGVAIGAQLLYLAFRFNRAFGLSAVVAMVHDVLIVLGVFAWLGKPIDGVFLAALLTIIGLSVNDTVVVFDRIRERWWGGDKGSLASVANTAVLDTVPRTINTGLGAMFILAALAVLGGDSLHDFALALLLGLVVGTYSSVFTATPLLVVLNRRWPMPRSRPVKTVRDGSREDSGAVV